MAMRPARKTPRTVSTFSTVFAIWMADDASVCSPMRRSPPRQWAETRWSGLVEAGDSAAWPVGDCSRDSGASRRAKASGRRVAAQLKSSFDGSHGR